MGVDVGPQCCKMCALTFSKETTNDLDISRTKLIANFVKTLKIFKEGLDFILACAFSMTVLQSSY